jgi:hypothetical protein
VWAYATAGFEAPALFEAVGAAAVEKMATLTPRNLASTLWAFAKARLSEANRLLFAAAAAEAQRTIAAFNAQDLANTAWAFATAGIDAPLLFEAVASEAPKKMASFNAQDLANTAWAFATAGFEAPGLFEAMEAGVRHRLREFSPVDFSQLHQVLLHLRLDAPQHPLTLFLSEHEAEIRAAHFSGGPRPSRSQRDASEVLARVGWRHEFEHVTAEGVSLDMAQPASRVAVEFDGPTHYLAGASTVLDGASKAKARLLRRLGWTLIRVPHFEWDKLPSSDRREDYLRRKLREASADGRRRGPESIG